MDKQKCLVLGEASESDEENVVISVVGDGVQKKGFLQGTVVPGEAPESDEEGDVKKIMRKGEIDGNNDELEKERDEDDEDEDSCSSASEAFMYRAAAAAAASSSGSTLKYNTLLHRKLYESNLSLQRGICDLLSRPLQNASQKLNIVNQQLLTSQVEIQDAVTSMKRSYSTFMKLDSTLGAVLDMPYLPLINVNVPPKNLTC